MFASEFPTPARRCRRAARGGFTLIELVVVVSIMALLVGVAIPVVGASLRVTDENTTRKRMEALAEGIRNFYEDTGQLPAALSRLASIDEPIAGWAGPYVDEGFAGTKGNIFYDAWQNAFEYLDIDAHTKRLRSRGLNRTDDSGGGDDIDLVVDVACLARKKNQQLLDEINNAIMTYNLKYRITEIAYDKNNRPEIPPDDPTGHWHTHRYLYEIADHIYGWVYQTHRHRLTDYHSIKAFYSEKRDRDKVVKDMPSVQDAPLKSPWSYTLSLLEVYGLLDNSDGRYTTDVWGNEFICGPDPVQYVTSSGSYTP